jgi:hypothetical protein
MAGIIFLLISVGLLVNNETAKAIRKTKHYTTYSFSIYFMYGYINTRYS